MWDCGAAFSGSRVAATRPTPVPTLRQRQVTPLAMPPTDNSPKTPRPLPPAPLPSHSRPVPLPQSHTAPAPLLLPLRNNVESGRATHARTAFGRVMPWRVMLSSPLQIMSVMDVGDGTFQFLFLRGGAERTKNTQIWGVFCPICLKCFLTNFCRNRRLDADPAYLSVDEGGADNEDDVGPFDCPERSANCHPQLGVGSKACQQGQDLPDASKRKWFLLGGSQTFWPADPTTCSSIRSGHSKSVCSEDWRRVRRRCLRH